MSALPEDSVGNSPAGDRHKQHIPDHQPARVHHEAEAGEDGKSHEGDGQAQFQCLKHGPHEGRLRDPCRDRRCKRGRRGQLTPDRNQKAEKMRNPGIDAELAHGIHDDHRQDDIGRRWR